MAIILKKMTSHRSKTKTMEGESKTTEGRYCQHIKIHEPLLDQALWRPVHHLFGSTQRGEKLSGVCPGFHELTFIRVLSLLAELTWTDKKAMSEFIKRGTHISRPELDWVSSVTRGGSVNTRLRDGRDGWMRGTLRVREPRRSA